MKIPEGMTLFLGAPGSGKTTLASFFCHKFMKKHPDKNCFCNVPILGTKRLDCNQDLGINLVEDGLICVDEGGIEYNNRAYKSLPKTTIQFAKLYRHYGIKHFLFFSQGMDIDITFIRLCDRVCLVRRSIIPFFVFIREVKKVVGIDEFTKQLVDQYEFKRFGCHWVFMPKYWKYFDTYETPFLPSKQWPIWDNKTRFIVTDESIDTPEENSPTGKLEPRDFLYRPLETTGTLIGSLIPRSKSPIPPQPESDSNEPA